METEGGLSVINHLSVWLEVFLNTHLPDIKKQNLLLKMGQRFFNVVFDYEKEKL